MRNEKVQKLTLTALMAALSYVIFTFLQIKVTLPGGSATSFHLGNAVVVLAALLLGGVYGGIGGAIGMTIGDLLDPIYITGAPKTFFLKLMIGVITGLVAHKLGKNYIFNRQESMYLNGQSLQHVQECSSTLFLTRL